MMGHPGDAAIMPLAEQAAKAGIKMMYQNVPVPKVMATFGGGYVGAQQEPQGQALGAEAVKLAGLKAGDTAIMIGPFDNENRGARERGTVEALEEAGVKVVKINSPPEWAAIRTSRIPVITAAIAEQSRRQGDRLSRRPDARQRADLHAGGGQEAGRDLQLRLRHQPADRRGASRAAGCS